MSRITERYSSAVRSSNLRSKPDTSMSDSDVIGAAGLAAKAVRTEVVAGKIVKRRGAPLAIALMRLFTGDNSAASHIVQLLVPMILGRAGRIYGINMARVEAEDIARSVLAWHRDGVCKACGGHGFKLAGGLALGEGRAVIGDAQCDECHGTRKVPFDSQFAMDRLELARWTRGEIEKRQAIAGAEAMRALRPTLEL